MEARLKSPLALAATVVVCALGLAACGTSSVASTARSSTGSDSGDSPPPKTVTARRLRPAAPQGLRRGTPVSRSFTGVRVFANRRVGFAVPNLPQAGSGTYPAVTTNGGKTWRTDGPVLHIPAAQGAIAVGQPGVLGPKIYFASCGACNTVIDVTPDAGTHWWQTFMPGTVLAVLGGTEPSASLTAIVKGRNGAPWVYVSSNGKHWTYEYNVS
jgi:hypothetical protein